MSMLTSQRGKPRPFTLSSRRVSAALWRGFKRKLSYCELLVRMHTDLSLMKRLQPLLVISSDVLQLLQRVFLLLQRLHVQLLTLHLREELIDRLRSHIA